ncbi:hypothetical protein [Variovorax sp. J31P207]|uniref:AbiU2 domain-containing protein n=1 Tax=Variovorax sp. J31P207 TaxID=3053510 RepID=UPI002577C3E5|nr:hypothetical protein [Variovorax sp. J31P207]MDM0068368.1 hypothetical protein [Variovorax sp. J31P207]
MTTAATPQMPPALQAEYDLLDGEVAALGYYLSEYQTLFGTTRERIDFLNQIAPVFFKMIFDTLWSEILLHMTRIAGPAVTRINGSEFHNLTIQRLPALVDAAARPGIEALVKTAVAACRFAQPARNKVLEHRDLLVALSPDSLGVTMGSHNQITEALGAIEAVLDAVSRHYLGRRMPFVHNIGWGIADDLIETLEMGYKAQQAAIAARSCGT